MAAADYYSQVYTMFVGYFGRPPAQAGLDHYAGVVDKAGGKLDAVLDDFHNALESKTLFANQSTEQQVNKIFQNLFGRDAAPTGLNYWTGKILSGEVALSQAAYAIAAGAQPADAAVLTAKIDTAKAWVASLDTTAEILTFSTDAGRAAAREFLSTVKTSTPATQAAVDAATKTMVDGGNTNPGQTFTLTADQDTLTGTAGNDTYTAGSVQTANAGLQDSLQSVDSINGGAGTDTLNVTLNQGVVAAPSLTSVENVNLRVTAAASSLSLAGATGVTNVTIQNSTIDSTAVTGTVSGVGAANLAVKNQKTAVSFDGSTATTLGLTLDTVGTGGTVAPAHIAVDLGLVAAAKATTLNITANNANADVNATQAGVVTTVNVAATGVNELKLNDAAATATAITVTGAGSVDFVTNGVALTAVKTLTVADGGVTIDATGGVLETATTGAGKDTLTVVGTKVKTISTGAGDDKVTVATDALGATAVVDLGAGNDTLSLAAEPTAGVTLKGGDGTDTLDATWAIYDGITATTPFTAPQLALITGFETLSISDVLATGKAIDLSKIAGLVSFQTVGVAAAGTATVSSVGANAAVIIKGDIDTNKGGLVVTLKDATGTADVLNLTLNDKYTEDNSAGPATIEATNAFVVTASGVETINVTSTGTATTKFLAAAGTVADGVVNTLTLTDDALATLNVSGDQGFKFVSGATQIKLATVDASANTAGAQISAAAAATDGTAAAITIKGSATAANTLTGSGNTDTIVGGSKADVITGGAKGDTLTGNGGNDKFVFAAGDSSIGTGNFDSITDFVANTYGQGTDGKADSKGAIADATKLTGDTISIAKAGAGTNGIKVDVLGSAADALTFLQNQKETTTVVAALDSSTGNLYIDNTADGVADFYVHLTGVTTINAAAFVLI